MNWDKLREFLQTLAWLALVFGVLYLIAYTPRTHERIKKQLFDETIPYCAKQITENLSKYDENGYSYRDDMISFTLEDDLIDCLGENYPEK